MRVWYMASNHTFAGIPITTRQEIVNRAAELFKMDKHGSLFVRDRMGGRLETLTLHGPVTRDDLNEWLDKLLIEDEFDRLISA